MSIEMKRKPMSLADFLCETYEPNYRFTEDADYVIFHDNYYSGLAILIDKDAYYVERKDRGHYFDILNIVYELPFAPSLNIRYGNYFIGEHGPSFFLTEPKSADDLLFYSKGCFGRKAWSQIKYRNDYSLVISVEDWISATVVNERHSMDACKQALKNNQSKYDLALAHFYCRS